MPTSHFKQIPDIVAAAIELNPTSILEVGIGCGKYGALLREYLTVWDHYFEPFDMDKVKIDGIEVHEMYRTAPAWACYDSVYIGDVRARFPQLILQKAHYDMVLMVDVLEHFEQESGLHLLEEALLISDAVLVGLPSVFFETVEVWNNPHEIHRAAYPPEVIMAHGLMVDIKRADDSSVMVIRKP